MNKNQQNNTEQQNSFDVKFYIFKVLGYWQLFLVTIVIALIVARFLNGYRQERFSLDTMISVKEENNPLFSTGTNLTFNWGGASDLLQTVQIILTSRTHNEKVVDSLQFYVGYFKDGRYRLEDVYGKTPFDVEIDTSAYQLQNNLITITTLENNEVNLSFDTGEGTKIWQMRYSDKDLITSEVQEKQYSKTFFLAPNAKGYYNANVNEPYFKFSISSQKPLTPGETYYINFINFNGAVGRYRGVRVTNVTQGASLLRLQMEGANKNRIVDYLNASVAVLARDKQQQ